MARMQRSFLESRKAGRALTRMPEHELQLRPFRFVGKADGEMAVQMDDRAPGNVDKGAHEMQNSMRIMPEYHVDLKYLATHVVVLPGYCYLVVSTWLLMWCC